ncbi:DUF5787 family protein [Halalkalicoccus jeotgali]|uniref:Uncharacterized protein n=1 Tax=Halalkalicoccus jeotgali (strain DSM 18796 / CECT 7217 / JCM 14584 / KCTC 4019 / B3) TaxID=795797 RepID=D8J8B6_HALJB|nr:DUF5787 family protein [Halalkalicoccus jeotgali]ADJ16162.1 hypothetical protein HacjB3_13905 [Halalkalicoccus jeotgali B3]ELY37591.1 hypothetical protein C497_09118 [Halalkalicoccus jeotgali B3]
MACERIDHEFGFELRVCRWAEREWPPDGDAAAVISRQLGTRSRRWDTIVLEVDPEGLDRRSRFGHERLDSDLLFVVRNAPTEWVYYREALPDPGYPWRYVRESIHEADRRAILDVRKRANRIEIRRRFAYPEWCSRVIAIENKPDLDAGAARALSDQLQRDVALALADEVWVATRATGERIEPALLEDLPVEAGILVFSGGEASVRWHPRRLAVEDPGTRIVERPSEGEFDRSGARFEYASPEWKARKRLEIAERAYERGWRSYIDTMRPDCRHFEGRIDGEALVPHCGAKCREQTAAECSGSCPDFSPEPPAWRTRGWPVEGGPGRGVRRVLERRRKRARSRATGATRGSRR